MLKEKYCRMMEQAVPDEALVRRTVDRAGAAQKKNSPGGRPAGGSGRGGAAGCAGGGHGQRTLPRSTVRGVAVHGAVFHAGAARVRE